LYNAIVRHIVDCEGFSRGDLSFRLTLQGWQENLPMSDYFWLREATFERIKPYISRCRMACRVLTIGALSAE
jgi:hypothetical protein